MMLTEREEFDIFNNDQVVRVLIKYSVLDDI